jgi:hypothetical protein
MTTDMQPIPAAVLDEAEAIVEAESMRLTQDWDQWDSGNASWPDPAPRGPRPGPAHRGAAPPRWTASRPRHHHDGDQR